MLRWCLTSNLQHDLSHPREHLRQPSLGWTGINFFTTDALLPPQLMESGDIAAGGKLDIAARAHFVYSFPGILNNQSKYNSI